jgi:hypothetical protein
VTNRTDQAPNQPTPEPIRITEPHPLTPNTVEQEIAHAQAALDETGDWDRNSHAHTRDAAVLLHFRLQRLLDALNAEHATAVNA